MHRSQPYPKITSYRRHSSFVLLLLLVTVRAANHHSLHQILPARHPFELPDLGNAVTPNPTGLTKDRCEETADCVAPRICATLSGEPECTEQDCSCFPPKFQFCVSNKDCVTGEVCAKTDSTAPHCQSAAHVSADPEVFEFFRANGTGLTLDTCAVTANCRPPRQCTPATAPEEPVCTGDRTCLCRPPVEKYCSSSSQCVDGERCIVLSERARCVSLNFADGESLEWDSSLGLTGDFCRSNDECTAERRCLSGSFTEQLQCKEGSSCTCIPLPFVFCSQSTVCADGEVCVESDGEPLACYSRQAAQFVSGFDEVEPSLGLLFAFCTSTKECKPPRECVTADSGGLCEGGINCQCFPPGSIGCNGNDDCKTSEMCVVRENGRKVCLKESAAKEEGFPVVGSEEAEEFGTQTQELSFPEIQRHCIGRSLLKDLAKDELWLERDVIAHVLCDSAWNCATAGHVVLYRGEGMMMKSYCSRVRCVVRVMHVNSPRYKKGFRIKGADGNFEFSAFAAQYGTRAEEMLLSFALRIGL